MDKPGATRRTRIRAAALGLVPLLFWGCAVPGTPSRESAPVAAPVAAPAAEPVAGPVATPARKPEPISVSQAEPASAPPAPVPAPAAPPARAGREEYHSRRTVDLPLDKPALAGRRGAELWSTTDGGKTWSSQGAVDLSRPSILFPAPADGRYGFAIVPMDEGGRRDSIPKPGDAPSKIHVVDTVSPVVEVLAPNGGEVLGAGKSTIVQWVAEDPNLAPAGVTLEFSTDGKQWLPVARDLPNSGRYHWDLPQTSSTTARVRIVARDLAGNTGIDASDKDFTVDGTAPELRITGPAASSESPVQIEWTGGDLGGAGLKRATLWVTRDNGASWKPHGDDEDLRSPYLFNDLDGVYGLRFTTEDRVGNVTAPPVPGTPPSHVLTVDRTKPDLKISSPAAGGYLAGLPLQVQWMARDALGMPANGIDLHVSADDGKTWSEIARGVKNDGAYAWSAPKTAGTDYRVRVTATDHAGNRREALSARFGVDGSVPEARLLGPDRSGAHAVQLAYEIRNRGSAPLASVKLYYKPEHVKEWTLYGTDPDAQSPMLFAKADGKYALYLTCSTEAGEKGGVAQKAPSADTEPQLTMTIDATPPQVVLKTFTGGGYFMAGSAMDVTWSLAESNPEPRGATLHHSPDGGASWNLVAERVDAAKGSHRWTLPAATGARHKIRVTVQDVFGNRGSAESEKPFTIDADLPLAAILEKPPAVIRSGHVSLRYKASDLTSGVKRVILYGRKSADKGPYKPLSETTNLEGVFEVDLPGEGLWGLLLVAEDAAGHRSADVDRGPRPDALTAVDLTKPELALKSSALPSGARTWISPAWEVEWTASDTLSAAEKLTLRIEHSSDGGKTWFVAVPKHPNTGRADLRAHVLPGKKIRLRLVAADEAGNEAEEATGDFDPGEVPPPPLVLRGVEDGRSYVSGSGLGVVWSSPDKTIRDASLELSRDGGRTWQLYMSLSTGTPRVVMPETEGRYHFRVTSRDSVGRPLSSNYVQFDIISGVDQVQLIANPTAEPNKLVRALIEPKGILKTAKELRLEISENGKDWTSLGPVRGTDITFPAPGVAGEYVLRVAVKGADGREYDSKHARLKVVGTEAGPLRLQAFRGGQAYAGGTGRVIAVYSPVDLAGVRVEFSEDSGKDGSWKDITADVQRVTGGFFWRLPKLDKTTCRLRVSCKDAQGKDQSDASGSDFSIDSGGKAPVPGPVAVPVPPKREPDPAPAVVEPAGDLVLVSPLPAALKGGTSLPIRWKAADAAAKVQVLLVIGEKAEPILKDQAAMGTSSWEVPRIDARGCRLRLLSGGRTWDSNAFDIRSTAPPIDGVDIELPGR